MASRWFGNAFATFTLYPPDSTLLARMDVNAQLGSLSAAPASARA